MNSDGITGANIWTSEGIGISEFDSTNVDFDFLSNGGLESSANLFDTCKITRVIPCNYIQRNRHSKHGQ